MITEQYVSFDTAKMLKKAGFDVPCDKWYGEEGFFMSGNHKYCKCPTQQLAARWLREVHHIHVLAFYQYHRGKYAYYSQKLDAPCAEIGMNLSNEDYNSQEEALEEGLQEALQIIIKNKEDEQRND